MCIHILLSSMQDTTQHRNADYIASMKERMKDMEREEEELRGMPYSHGDTMY